MRVPWPLGAKSGDCREGASRWNAPEQRLHTVQDADKGFDAERIFERLYELSMVPNIKQRLTQKGPRGKGRKRLRYLSRAKKEFRNELYRWRGMIEAIFGAEATDERNELKTRFRITEHREKWARCSPRGGTSGSSTG